MFLSLTTPLLGANDPNKDLTKNDVVELAKEKNNIEEEKSEEDLKDETEVKNEEPDSEESIEVPPVINKTTMATDPYAIKYKQAKINYRNISLEFTNLAALKKVKSVDRIVITGNLTYKNKITRSFKSGSKKIADIPSDTKRISVTAPTFGKYKINVVLYKGSKKVKTLPGKNVGIVAEEYNLAPLKASTPVLIYSLKLPFLTKTISGEPIPSITFLTRSKQYDWDKKLENLYDLPYLTDAETKKGGAANYEKALNAMSDFVKDQYSLNKNSKFNLFVNDIHMTGIPIILYKNKIPQDQYSIRMITDGSGSYSYFIKTYNQEDASQKHETMQKEYKTFRENTIKTGKIDYSVFSEDFKYYAYAITSEEKDAEWWLVRKSADTLVLEKDKSSFLDKTLSDPKITSNYINNLLDKLDAKQKKDFKALYKFDDTEFVNTRKKKKKIMMVLGTSKAAEAANPIWPYVQFLMAHYGDKYEYYYKGHPGYINLSSDAKAKIKSLGMKTLDPSIAAELFIFYNPDIYVSGYPSSTFQNVGTEDNDCALFTMKKKEAYAAPGIAPYVDKLDMYISNPVKNKSNSEIQKHLNSKLFAGHEVYVGEFHDRITKYDLALFDCDTSDIYYYEGNENDGYLLAERPKNIFKSQKITTSKSSYKITYGGKYTLKPKTSGSGFFSYKSSNTKVATVDSEGLVKVKGTGKATITITASATALHTKATKKITILAIPKKQAFTYRKSKKKQTLKLKWKKDKRASGYQVVIARDKKFKKGKKTATLKSYKKNGKTFTKLSRKKKYYMKVRSYKIIGGKKYYGAYSKIKTVKIK